MTAKKNLKRCSWAANERAVTYHDEEWGLPNHDDRHLFEMLILEGAQAGLSWDTILKKRAEYRRVYHNFDPIKVARYGEKKIAALLANPGIIRNRLKVRASVANAKAFLAVQKEFGTFDAYIWAFVGGKPVRNRWKTMAEIPVKTPEAEALSKDLKKRGFTFVGPTIMYAFMQAVGMVNDHTTDCFRHRQVG
jgi:DNA-3-methyladenine glycosylase I